MHQLISQRGPSQESPPQTADQVIEEIDQMLKVNFAICSFHPSLQCDLED